jgi:uncharacterized protein (DUF1786 family)
MKILTVDIGTGTQDIFLYDSRLSLENGLKMVVPSPTMIVNRKIKDATRAGEPILLTGVIMGGGPSGWAAEDHIKAGLKVYATPQAARSFNDDLEEVERTGIRVVSEDEAARLTSIRRIELRDFDFPAIRSAFEAFGATLEDLDAVAAAVFDHGNAPREVSDRKFRFDYLDERIRSTRGQGYRRQLGAFAHRAGEVPEIMTRLQAVVDSARDVDAPLIVMDTAPAAVLGATYDPRAVKDGNFLVANVGNFHTLAFRLVEEGIEGVFEHHTGLIDLPKLEGLLVALADSSLRNEQVFDDHGHGALMYHPKPMRIDKSIMDVAVTGPRRNLMKTAKRVQPYFAVPFGDMMIAGCFGLLSAAANLLPAGEIIIQSLEGNQGIEAAPWD